MSSAVDVFETVRRAAGKVLLDLALEHVLQAEVEREARLGPRRLFSPEHLVDEMRRAERQVARQFHVERHVEHAAQPHVAGIFHEPLAEQDFPRLAQRDFMRRLAR